MPADIVPYGDIIPTGEGPRSTQRVYHPRQGTKGEGYISSPLGTPCPACNMKLDPQTHHRTSIRLEGYDYSQAGGYFLTIVTFRREHIFGEVTGGEMRVNALGRLVQAYWDAIPAHFPNTTMDAFVIMPNHVHGILFVHDVSTRRGTIYRAPTTTIEKFGKPTVGSLSTIIRTFKSSVTRRAGREMNTSNIWQRNYYEHILRDC